MSLRLVGPSNSPLIVATAGLATLAVLPALNTALASSAVPLTFLKFLNVAAFATNVVAVSVPGRLDGQMQDEELRKGATPNPEKTNTTQETPAKIENDPLLEKSSVPAPYSLEPSRTLLYPSGWAFAIWAPIYAGEAAFVIAQCFAPDASALASVLRNITAPFVAANVCQSLWCASFRPSYGEGWRKYVSVASLAGTAYCLSLVHSAGCSAATAAAADPSSMPASLLFLLPLTVHFGWTTAATLVNINGAVASEESASPWFISYLGYASAVVAVVVGAGLTLERAAPAYGLTLAWALAASADGMKKRIPSRVPCAEEDVLAKGAVVQKHLCRAGSIVCVAACAYLWLPFAQVSR